MKLPRSQSDLMGLVGWLFADVLLALAVVFLATQTGGAVVLPPSAAETTTTTTTALPPPEPPPGPTGVDGEYVCLRVELDAGLLLADPSTPGRDAHLKEVEDRFRAQLDAQGLGGRDAGIVLTFGVASDALVGRERAERFNAELLPRFPVFQRSDGSVVASRAFWDGASPAAGPEGSMQVNVYPILDAAHPAIPPGPAHNRC